MASNRAVKNEMLTIQRQRDSVYVEDLNVKYLKEISLIPSLVCTVCWRFLFPDQKKVCYKDLPSLCVRDGEILCKFCYEKTLKSCFSYRSLLGNNLWCGNVPQCFQGLTLVEKK